MLHAKFEWNVSSNCHYMQKIYQINRFFSELAVKIKKMESCQSVKSSQTWDIKNSLYRNSFYGSRLERDRTILLLASVFQKNSKSRLQRWVVYACYTRASATRMTVDISIGSILLVCCTLKRRTSTQPKTNITCSISGTDLCLHIYGVFRLRWEAKLLL